MCFLFSHYGYCCCCFFFSAYVQVWVRFFVCFVLLLIFTLSVSVSVLQPHKSLECGAPDLIKQNNQWKLLKTLFIVKFNVIRLVFVCVCSVAVVSAFTHWLIRNFVRLGWLNVAIFFLSYFIPKLCQCGNFLLLILIARELERTLVLFAWRWISFYYKLFYRSSAPNIMYFVSVVCCDMFSSLCGTWTARESHNSQRVVQQPLRGGKKGTERKYSVNK